MSIDRKERAHLEAAGRFGTRREAAAQKRDTLAHADQSVSSARAVIMLHAGAVLAQGAVADLKQNEQPAFELELHDNSAAVVAALERAGLGITAKGDGRLVLRGGEDVPERVRDLAAENGWPLRRLVPRAATLEQTFLQLQRIASDPITALRPRLEEVASL